MIVSPSPTFTSSPGFFVRGLALGMDTARQIAREVATAAMLVCYMVIPFVAGILFFSMFTK